MLGLLPYDDDQVDDDDEDLSEVKKEPKGNKRISKHQGATAAQNADDLYLETIHHPSRLGYHRYMCVLCTYYACVCVGLRQWGETRKRINGIERRGEKKERKNNLYYSSERQDKVGTHGNISPTSQQPRDVPISFRRGLEQNLYL
jgi:hypothetical protein